MESIASLYVNFNFNYALDLYTKTDFSICDTVIDAVKNSDLKKFIVGDMNCEIHFLPFADDSHFDDGHFLLFVDSDDMTASDKISDDENLNCGKDCGIKKFCSDSCQILKRVILIIIEYKLNKLAYNSLMVK